MFAFRLCLALGFPHPDHLMRELTSYQLAEWQAYYSLEPWGYKFWTWLGGLMASVVANFSPASKKHNWMPSDFIPKRDDEQEKKPQEPDSKAVSKGIMSYFKNVLRARKVG